ncbi:MAG: dihydrodipicolinate synthase family protein [Propionibacteriaceae bacterium]|nr:dihydrodipicolinate synthase family protein [Propionibacteriaceae bacterium]
MSREKLTGIYIPMVTPFNADESINFAGIKSVTDFLVDNGVSGVIPSGSTGEMVALTKEEQIAVNRETVKAAAGRIKVVASTGAYRTGDVVEMSVAAQNDGADGVMVVTPWYMAPNENELLLHYETLRKAIDIPVMVYHNPYYSTCLMSDEFMAKLYNEGFIDAVKERQADVYRQQDLRYLTDDNFGIFYGYDVSPVESVSCWADGWVCGTGNLFPKENTEVFHLAKDRKMEAAMKAHFEKIRPYLPLFTKPTADGMPTPWLQIIKEGLKLRGVDAGVCRKPVISELPTEVKDHLKVVLKEYGYLV